MQPLERCRQVSVLQWCRLLERTGLILQQSQVVQRVDHEIGFAVAASVVGDALCLGDQVNIDPIDRTLDQNSLIRMPGRQRVSLVR